MPWLEGSWSHMEGSRQHLEAQVSTALGRKVEAAVVRRRIFKASPAVSDLHAWLDLLSPHQQSEPIEHARTLTTAHADPLGVALLLMDMGDDMAAEAALTSAPGAIEGGNYRTLVSLAEALEHKGLWTGATVVYRALLVAISGRAYAPAYRHGAEYWARLQALALKCTWLMPLEPPDEFEARMRVQHKRKTSFWAHVSGARRADDDNQADTESWAGDLVRVPARATRGIDTHGPPRMRPDRIWASPTPPFVCTSHRPNPDRGDRQLRACSAVPRKAQRQ